MGAKTAALPLPAWVIGVYDSTGRATAMTASWTGVCCSMPPCVYFSARESRYTHGCVIARKAFTVNIPSQQQAAIVDYLGTTSGRKTDKLAAAGLTPVPSDLVDAPFIQEFPLIMECKLVNTLELGTHSMFIGEIMDVRCDENVLNADGNIDVAKLQPFIYSTVDGKYYAVTDVIGKGYELGKQIGS
jgi:flavin reductase (DIM6/NTAB) family NADH-FMN oxidoreductase RutF